MSPPFTNKFFSYSIRKQTNTGLKPPQHIYLTSLCSPSTAAVNVTLLAFAAARRAVLLRRPPLSIDISWSRGAQQQTRGCSGG